MKKFLSNPALVFGTINGFCVFTIVYMLSKYGMHFYLAFLITGVWFMLLGKYNKKTS